MGLRAPLFYCFTICLKRHGFVAEQTCYVLRLSKPAVAGRSYPTPEVGAAAQRSNPTSKERWLCGRRRAKRSYSTFKVRRGGGEEIPLVQDKEQRLRFAGAAMKRYPTSNVRETQGRR